jgi:hypothetical protein
MTAQKQWKSIPKDPSEQEKFDMALRFQTHLNKSAKESYEKVGLMKGRYYTIRKNDGVVPLPQTVGRPPTFSSADVNTMQNVVAEAQKGTNA